MKAEKAVYSIPDYSLRFAAHCRSRLRFNEQATHDVREQSPPRFWIRFAPHVARAGLARGCARKSPRPGAR